MTITKHPVELWTNPDHKERLLSILKKKSYVEGEVTLASGKVSDFYIDCRQSSLDAEGAFLLGQIFYSWIEHLTYQPDAIGGMTMGADPLVTATSVNSFLQSNPIPGLLIRKQAKDHGMNKQIEGMGCIEPGSRVILLEDVVTTGGSTLKAINACKNENLVVEDVFCIVDRQEGGCENINSEGINLTSIFTRKDFKG